MPESGGEFQPYDPVRPPANVATTTTDQGRTVPFVVRRETGAINRGWYAIAVLFDPARAWQPGGPAQPAWNGKMTTHFGGSSEASHQQHDPPNVLIARDLGLGFLVGAGSMNTHGQNQNDVVHAETLMMWKERVIEHYGPIRYTIASGCSGGSSFQLLLANAYPGLVDGIQPNCTYPDARSSGSAGEAPECELLLHHWGRSSLPWSDVQKAAVAGNKSVAGCLAWQKSFVPKLDPAINDCGMKVRLPWMYHPTANPYGERCVYEDYQINIWGVREPALWTANEKLRGRGFARRPRSNVGIEYGRVALEQGVISTEQFVELNQQIGGKDMDWRFVDQRMQADPGALDIAYATGRVVDGRRLDRVPIIDLRGEENDSFHQDFSSYSLRERLKKANGHAGNHVIVHFAHPRQPPPHIANDALRLIDRWLAAIEADTSAAALPAKVLRHKPAEATDACWLDGNARKTTDAQACAAAYPVYANVRIAADGPLANDVLACQLKPLQRSAYRTVFSGSQWARLQAVFPAGVCDWSRPGIGQQPSQPWVTFAGGPGSGKPMPPPPRSRIVPSP